VSVQRGLAVAQGLQGRNPRVPCWIRSVMDAIVSLSMSHVVPSPLTKMYNAVRVGVVVFGCTGVSTPPLVSSSALPAMPRVVSV